MTLRPPGGFIPPTNPAVHADTRRRVLAQEQVPLPAPPEPRFSVTACSAGQITTDVVSNPYRPWWAITLERVVVDVTGGTDWVATVLRDDEPVVEVTGTGDGLTQKAVTVSIAPMQKLTVGFTGNANVVTVTMWCRGVGGGGLIFAVPYVGGG